MNAQKLSLLLCSFFFCLSLFGQPSSGFLNKSIELSQNEEKLRNYHEEGLDQHYLELGFEIDTSGIKGLYRFFEDPFGEKVSTDLKAFFDLKKEVDINKSRKAQLDDETYKLLKTCQEGLPRSLEAYLADDRLYLSVELENCVIVKEEEGFLSRLIEEGILQTYYEAALIFGDTKSIIEKAYRSLKEESLAADSIDIKSFLEALDFVEDEIDKMGALKREIPDYLYPQLKTCNFLFPPTYLEFLEGEKYILSGGILNCFFRKIERSEREKIKEFIRLQSTKEVVLTNDREIDGIPDFIGKDIDSPPAMSLSPLSPSTLIIDATAQFLVERTREELVLTFFDQFELRTDSMVELQYLFANSYALLKNREYLQVPSLGSAWQEAFELDLRLLPESFDHMIQESSQYEFLRDNSAYKLFRLSDDLIRKRNLSVSGILQSIAPSSLEACKTHLDSSVYLLKNLQPGLFYGESAFIGEELQKLSTREREIFVALQYQDYPELFRGLEVKESGANFASIMQSHTQQFFEKEYRLTLLLSNAQRDIQSLSFPRRPKVNEYNAGIYQQLVKDYLDALPYQLSSLADISKQILESAYLFHYYRDENAIYSDRDYQRSIAIIQSATEVIGAVESRKPSRIFLASLRAFDPFFYLLEEEQIKKIKELEKVRAKSQGADKVFVTVELNRSIRRLEQVRLASEYLAFYGGFFLDVIHAKSSEEIKAALQRYALPAGSYRLKRRSLWSIEVGSYPGLYGGQELILSDSLGNPSSFVTGFTAPIGISINFAHKAKAGLGEKDAYKYVSGRNGVRGKRLSGWSWGLFIPLVDLSAPFSYRWKEGFGDRLPEEIQWQQVLSPGAYFVCGIKGLPLAFSLGGQYVPRLRSIGANGNEVSGLDALRFGVNISLDLPIFSIYHK